MGSEMCIRDRYKVIYDGGGEADRPFFVLVGGILKSGVFFLRLGV